MRQNVQYEITSKMPRKIASDWGYAPDFIRVTYDAFQWMGYLSQTPRRHLWRLHFRAFGTRLGACGASITCFAVPTS